MSAGAQTGYAEMNDMIPGRLVRALVNDDDVLGLVSGMDANGNVVLHYFGPPLPRTKTRRQGG